jgi:hypothetical protein
VHSEGTPHPGGRHEVRYGERAETYLRLLTEASLRSLADEDIIRVERAADVLIEAGVLSSQLAARILADLRLALRVRGRREPARPAARLGRLTGFQPRGAPGPAEDQSPSWRVLPAPSPSPGARLMALILLADKALAPATLLFPAALGPPESQVPPLTTLAASDDLGTRYWLGFSDGTWAGSAWTGTLIVRPAPPGSARTLEIKIIDPNVPLLRAELTTPLSEGTAPRAVSGPVAESPGERLLTRKAEATLAALALGGAPGRDLSRSGLAELVATLEAAGMLSPLSAAPARLAALSQLLGLATEGPAGEVPARWTAVMARYGRRRRLAPVPGTAAIGAALPEINGARVVIAGLHSGGSGSFLHVVMAGGLRPLPRRRPPGQITDAGFSWWARDDAGDWHLGTVADVSPVGGAEALLRLALLPPLCHATTTLTVEISGPASQVTANLPVRW